MQQTLAIIQGLLAKQVNKDASELGPDVTLEDVGVDSFDFIELVFLIEEEFGIQIDYNHNDVEARLKTVGDIVSAVDGLIAAKDARARAAQQTIEAA